MLAIAACVNPAGTQGDLNAEKLFIMAERSLHHRRMETKVDIIQSLILLSLRQTGCGDKQSAAVYAGRACSMVLIMGLHLSSKHHATIAEETGRPFLLRYRRSSTPLPSINEIDELETWPPLAMSSAPLPSSVRHVTPRRSYVLSCFVWTCRLACIVEEILDMETEGPDFGEESQGWDQQFAARCRDKRSMDQEYQDLSHQLDAWRGALPKHLDVNPSASTSPLPHHIVSLAWWNAARILLHSRLIRRHPASSPINHDADPSRKAHSICSESAQSIVELLATLDRHRLLGQASSDTIHMLSLTALFEAFDSTSTDSALAHLSKVNFSQCCLWLREVSSSWPAASAHKVFFEGLIRGGLQLSSPEDAPAPADPSPSTEASVSSSVPDGLRNIRRNLSMSEQPPASTSPANPTLTSLFQLPQFYWNHLSTTTAQQTNVEPVHIDLLPSMGLGPSDDFGFPSGYNPQADQSPLNSLFSAEVDFNWDQLNSVIPEPSFGTTRAMPQDEIYSVLMGYMMDAAKAT
ncbi:hypothetical protein P7C73_g1927, partial [Tremellales sp. Uapishka_1]